MESLDVELDVICRAINHVNEVLHHPEIRACNDNHVIMFNINSETYKLEVPEHNWPLEKLVCNVIADYLEYNKDNVPFGPHDLPAVVDAISISLLECNKSVAHAELVRKFDISHTSHKERRHVSFH